MNLQGQDPRQSVELCGYSVPSPSCVIQFYYCQDERQRFAMFLKDGLAAGEPVIVAATRDGLDILTRRLEVLGVHRPHAYLSTIEIQADLRNSVQRMADTLRLALGRRGGRARLLADFGDRVGPELIFEVEGALATALDGLQVVAVTQYNGRSFAAPVAIEQFRTHALALVGNALYQENRNYTSPGSYYRARAASAKT